MGDIAMAPVNNVQVTQDYKEIKPVHSKEISPEYSLEGLTEAAAPML